MRNNKNTTFSTIESKFPSFNLPQDEDQIDYKIYTKFTKYDEKPYMIADQ